MANHASAEKSLRKIKKVTAQNRSQMSALRTACRRVREDIKALATPDQSPEKTTADFALMQKHLMKAARKNMVHKNKVRRLISRAAKKIKAI